MVKGGGEERATGRDRGEKGDGDERAKKGWDLGEEKGCRSKRSKGMGQGRGEGGDRK